MRVSSNELFSTLKNKFHKDSPSDKKIKFNLASGIELLETANFLYNFV